jgi:hypothetical protein
MADSGRDAKLFARGKVAELRAELQSDKKDKGWNRKRVRWLAVWQMGQAGRRVAAAPWPAAACCDAVLLARPAQG